MSDVTVHMATDQLDSCDCHGCHFPSVSSCPQLLMVYPEENSLALVYRDKETLKFVKHINHRSSTLPIGDSCRRAVYDFSFVYYE